MLIKILIAAAIAIVLLAAAAGLGLWYLMQQPLYRPGMAQTRRLQPPSQTDQPNAWQVERDVTLRYLTAGTGRPVLVLHGGPGFSFREPWAGLDALGDRHQFYYYDQRGCGRSTKPFDRFAGTNFYANMKSLEGTLGLAAQIADIERIRRILGEEKLVLIGSSFGGFIATMYAAEFPARVEKLVLVAPADVLVMPSRHGDLFELVAERLPDGERATYREFLADYLDFRHVFDNQSETTLAERNRDFGVYYLAAAGTPAAEREASMAAYAGDDANGGWMVPAVYFSLGRRHDYRNALSAVTAPTLVIHGANDIQPDASSRAYVEALPNATLRVIEGAGHFVFEEQAEAFAEAVAEFLKQ
ncbi:MAG: alpha/beta hydrolase [Phycisphaerales bacterium]|nr:alpha/beta hydrolase [Phycisphaerae bacterium]NNM24418.1 alpha/beta hydrolase [Phycisphaerales bacterium]